MEQSLAGWPVYPAAGFEQGGKILHQPAIECLQARIRVKPKSDSPPSHSIEPDEFGYATGEMTGTVEGILHGTREAPAVTFEEKGAEEGDMGLPCITGCASCDTGKGVDERRDAPIGDAGQDKVVGRSSQANTPSRFGPVPLPHPIGLDPCR